MWSVLCQSEPERAIAALDAAANNGQWPADAWRPFLESVADSKDQSVSGKVLSLIAKAPSVLLTEAVFHIGSWLYRQRALLLQGDAEQSIAFLQFWDKFADVVYADVPLESLEREHKNDRMTAALNEPGGLLAATILDMLIARKPAQTPGSPMISRRELQDRSVE